ncbi:YdeI/OmpD-associated family protein [Arcicella sp. LKC2W]|uniref:YdeI/OmpD-associated family protein n=1 Tax=Arcicella sp. LKC2W TaxID=2984198 RepID=UPI002B21167E|nr:YdeI/OmpD-associated family protein [Arcicella sp. LKC2W]MEA5459054.1 YdeI/OmpD-associated family protein [Arcicella sp. LKC2W]
MVAFQTILQKFGEKGEKTGWTHVHIPADIAQEIKPNTKKGYRVKGTIDNFSIKLVALIPIGEGDFVIPINARMRKGICKEEGAMVSLNLEEDTDELPQSEELMICLEDEPKALEIFLKMPKGHQNYYSKWIESAKTIETKTKRITMTVHGLAMGMNYNEMMRYYKNLD